VLDPRTPVDEKKRPDERDCAQAVKISQFLSSTSLLTFDQIADSNQCPSDSSDVMFPANQPHLSPGGFPSLPCLIRTYSHGPALRAAPERLPSMLFRNQFLKFPSCFSPPFHEIERDLHHWLVDLGLVRSYR
jgi:hypothetical protein